MDDIIKIRRERYQREKQAAQKVERQAAQKIERQAAQKIERQAAQKVERQAAQQEEFARLSEVNAFLEQLTVNIYRLEQGDMLDNLQTIEAMLTTMVPKISMYPDMMDNLRRSIVILVDEVNDISERNSRSPRIVREAGKTLQTIMQLCGMEADIQLMDTSKDYVVANALRLQMEEQATRQMLERQHL